MCAVRVMCWDAGLGWGCPGHLPWGTSAQQGAWEGGPASTGAVGQGVEGTESQPACPLPAAQNVTVDEVISAYRQACQKLNCRQIPKLLRQLQGPWGQAGQGHGLA
jgi:hypothetical protein